MKLFSNYFSRLSTLAGMLSLGLLSVLTGHAQTTLSFDFESFSDGAILGQQGWSAGSDSSYLTVDDLTTDENIVSGTAASGNKSWQLIHGISNVYSFGPGTPFSPGLSISTSYVGRMFQGSFMFKPSVAGDNSWMELDTGNPAGNDRAEFIAYFNNNAGNLSVTAFDNDSNEVSVAMNLDASAWHLINFSVLRTGINSNLLNIQVDGGTVFSSNGVLAAYRDGSFPYAESNRIKFVGSPASSGFYIDDVSYSVIPEPSTYAIVAGLGALAFAYFRRKRAAVV